MNLPEAHDKPTRIQNETMYITHGVHPKMLQKIFMLNYTNIT